MTLNTLNLPDITSVYLVKYLEYKISKKMRYKLLLQNHTLFKFTIICLSTSASK